MAAPAKSVSARVAVGAAFMVAMRFASRIIGLVSTLVLVRVLTPADFGIVGIATLAYAVLDTLSDLSSGTALVRMAEPERGHYDTAWTLGLLRGLIVGALFAASAEPLAAFIHEPRVVELSYVLAVMAVVQGFENIGTIILQRELRFGPLFWTGVAAKVGGFLVCIPVACFFRTYWALLAGIIASRIVSLVLSYAISRYRPRLSLSAWRELLNFSKWMLVVNVQRMITDYLPVFTFGHINGVSAVGYYQVAYQIAALPVSEVAAPVRQPIFAGYAKVAHDRNELRWHFLDGFGLLFLLVTPACVGIALLAQPITALFLGPQWGDAVPLVALCAIYALLDSVAQFCQPLFFILHRERSFVLTNGLVLAIRMPLLVAAAYWYGIEAAAGTLAATALFNVLLWLWRVAPFVGLRAGHVVSATWRTMAAAAVMCLAVWPVAERWPAGASYGAQMGRFLCLCALGAAVHVAVLFGLWLASGSPRTAEAVMLRVAAGALSRLRPRRLAA